MSTKTVLSGGAERGRMLSVLDRGEAVVGVALMSAVECHGLVPPCAGMS
jgi:hypothetical protein